MPAAGVAILVLHARRGLADVDRKLRNLALTVAAEVRQELDEGETLDESVQEVEDVELSDTGVAIVGERDTVLLFRALGLLDIEAAPVGRHRVAATLDAAGSGVRLWPEPFVAGDRALPDAEGRPFKISQVYLDELVEECGWEARALGNEQQVDVRMTTGGECPFRGDDELRRQMLMNLLHNAVWFARPDGKSEVGRVVVRLPL